MMNAICCEIEKFNYSMIFDVREKEQRQPNLMITNKN